MEYVTVDGESIPKLGLGTWNLSGKRCVESVTTALELGYRLIDTAQRYGNEREVGRAIRVANVDRDSCFVTTKLWRWNLRDDKVKRTARRSLDRLGMDYVDLLLIHFPSRLVSTEETISAMNDLVDEGLVRHVGVSNFSLQQLERARTASRHPILTDQVQYHPYRTKESLLEYCQNEGILLTAYSPLVHGGIVDDRRLRAIGERYDKTPAQVALRWLTQQDMVATIPKASSREHLTENLRIFDFELTADEMSDVVDPSLLRTGLGLLKGRLGW